jgi:hypothetical protein
METTTFTALAERAGRWWTVRVPQVDGLAVQVRSLEQAEMMARKHIAEVLRVPPESIHVEIRTEGSMLPAVAKALQARQAAIRAAEVAADATHTAIQALLGDGSSFAEATVVLGLSPEEIAEFAPGSRSAAAGRGAPLSRGTPPSHGAPPSHGSPASHAAPAGYGGPGNQGGGGFGAGTGPAPAGGPRGAHSRGDAEHPVGPSGLPQRTRSSGPMAVHH